MDALLLPERLWALANCGLIYSDSTAEIITDVQHQLINEGMDLLQLISSDYIYAIIAVGTRAKSWVIGRYILLP